MSSKSEGRLRRRTISVGTYATKHSFGQLTDLLVSQAVPLGAALATTLITAHQLGPQGRGELAVVIGTANVIGAVIFSSVHIGTARAVLDGDSDIRTRVENGACAIAGGGLLLALAVWTIVPEGASMGAFTGTTTAISIAGAGLVTLNLVVLRTAQALGEYRAFRNGWLLQALLYPVLGIPLAASTHEPLLVAACWASAVAVSTAVVRLRCRRTFKVSSSGSPGATLRVVIWSLPAHVAVVGQQMLLRSDIVVLGVLATSASVGYYSVASAIAGLVSVVAEVASLFIFQRGMRTAEPSGRLSMLRNAYMLYAPVSIGIAAVLAVLTVTCMPIVLPDYKTAIPLTLVLLPAIVIQGFARVATAVLSTDRATRLLVGLGVANVISSAAYVPAVLAGGAMGAAIASGVLYSIQAILTVSMTTGLLKRRAGEQR